MEKFKIGDKVKVISSGFAIRNTNTGDIKTIKSFENVHKTTYPKNINFTDGGYGASYYDNWGDYLKLVKEVDLISNIEIW